MDLLWTVAGVLLGAGTVILVNLGWLLWTGYTPTDPVPWVYALLTALVQLLCGAAGGALAATIAGRRSAVWAVAAVSAALSLCAVALTRPWGSGLGSLWWLAPSLLLMTPAILLGGHAVTLRGRQPAPNRLES